MNYLESLKEIRLELNNKYSGLKVVAKNSKVNEFQSARVLDFSFDDEEVKDLYCKVAFEDRDVTYNVKLALKAGSLQLDLSAYLEKIEELNKVREQELREEQLKSIEAEQKQKEEERRKVREQLKQEKFNQRVSKQINEFKNFKIKKSTNSNYYTFIGWAAKHLVSIRASLPDYLDKYFVGRFGDVKREVVDNKKRTSGGFPMKFSLGMNIRFNEDLPIEYRRFTTSTKKNNISDVRLGIDLVENFGFELNNKPNIDKIIKEIPEVNLQDFKAGYLEE